MHGPIINMASLLYFLLLLPLDSLCHLDRARLVWFVDMVLYYKYEAIRVLRNMATFDLVDDVFVPPAGTAMETNSTIRIEQLQRPALALLMRDVPTWFAGGQHLRSAEWILMCATTCVRLNVALSPMLQKHA